ncbi:MAG: hypothetical protein Q7S06_01050 [Nanoarchaeota archaeon]|nr:hypothetical protein [Nanoarchaeota archaeon]
MINNKKGQEPTIFRKKNRKGLSTIIVTVLLIGLTIVAVGIVWAVVKSTLDRGASGTDLGVKCLGINVNPTSVTCSGTYDPTSLNKYSCYVRLERTGQGTEPIGGIKLIMVNATGGVSSPALDIPGDLSAFGTKNFNATGVLMTTGMSRLNKVDARVYFIDETGTQQLCSQAGSFTF